MSISLLFSENIKTLDYQGRQVIIVGCNNDFYQLFGVNELLTIIFATLGACNEMAGLYH